MRLEILAPLQRLGDFKLPHIFNHQPYFTLPPVSETREYQVHLWKEPILHYGKCQKIFVTGLEEDCPLFSSPDIGRVFPWFAGSLSHEARQDNLASVVNEGPAEWMDKSHKKRFILWPRIQEWADDNLNFVHSLDGGHNCATLVAAFSVNK